MRETDLYPPVKRFLEKQGFAVRSEIEGCDAVGLRGQEVVAVELKRSFGTSLLLQGLDRLSFADAVYLCVPEPKRSRGVSGMVRLCRSLGLGLLTVRADRVLVKADPAPWRPRRSRLRRERLLGEFARRSGDHNVGGSNRMPVVTAYREDALRCAQILCDGDRTVGEVRRLTGVDRAGTILYRDVYGWFARHGRGVYGLSPAGASALVRFSAVLAEIAPSTEPPARDRSDPAPRTDPAPAGD